MRNWCLQFIECSRTVCIRVIPRNLRKWNISFILLLCLATLIKTFMKETKPWTIFLPRLFSGKNFILLSFLFVKSVHFLSMLGNVCKDPLEGQPRVEATCVVSLINFNLNCRNFIFVTLPATKGNSNDSLGISCFFFFFFF